MRQRDKSRGTVAEGRPHHCYISASVRALAGFIKVSSARRPTTATSSLSAGDTPPSDRSKSTTLLTG